MKILKLNGVKLCFSSDATYIQLPRTRNAVHKVKFTKEIIPGQVNADYSPTGRLIAQTPFPTGRLTVFSEDGSLESQVVSDANGTPYEEVPYQYGSRWLDDHRLFFRSSNQAFLWNTDTKKATPIDGSENLGASVFSLDGETLFTGRTTSSSDIWLLEIVKNVSVLFPSSAPQAARDYVVERCREAGVRV